MTRAFLSSAAEDFEHLMRLKNDLSASGVEARTLDDVLLPGDSIGDALLVELDSADAFVVLLSRASERSSWVAAEIALAVAEQKRESRLRLIPVLIESGAEVPFFLRELQYLDLSSDQLYKSGLPRLVKALATRVEEVDQREAMRRRYEALELEQKALRVDMEVHEALANVRQKIMSAGLRGAASVAVISSTAVALSVGVYPADMGKWGIAVLFVFGGALLVESVWSLWNSYRAHERVHQQARR